MRRVLGYVLIGLGALFLVVGILAKPVLYTRLATVALDQKSTSVSQGEHMDALRVYKGDDDATHYDKLTDVTLRSTRNVIGIPGVVQDHPGNAFWQTTVTSEAVDVAVLGYSNEGVSFDRVSSESTNCCGDFKDAPQDAKNPLANFVSAPATHEGLFFKLPFNAQKTSYLWWDGDLGKTVELPFVRTESVEGADTYVYEQVIPQTEVTTRSVPGGIFGVTGDVDAKVMYGNTRTLWVEPNTGGIVKGQEQVDKSLVSDQGTVATTKGTIAYTEETVKHNAEDLGSKGKLLGFIRDLLLPVGIIVGLVLFGLGAFLLRQRRGAEGEDVYGGGTSDGDDDGYETDPEGEIGESTELEPASRGARHA